MSYVDNAKRQEEEKRKREEFNRNAARVTAAKDPNNPIAFGGASKLQAQVQQEMKNPEAQAGVQQAQARQAAMQKQREQMQAQAMAQKAAAAQDARRQQVAQQAAANQAKAVAAMPVKEQPKAVEQFKQQPVPPAAAQTTPQQKTTPQTTPQTPQAAAGPASTQVDKLKALYEKNAPKPAAAPMSDKELNSALTTVTSEDNSPISAEQGNKSFGLSIYEGGINKKTAAEDFAIANAAPQANQQQGFGMPQAPRRSMAEEQERQNLLRQATTVQKGANGITAAQMGVQSSLQSNSDKLANDNYQAQLGVASSLTQAQMREQGSNARAALGESAAGERQQAQLGFDADKLEQSASIDNRKLDMEQANSDIANKGPKMLNDLYDSLAVAESSSKAATTDEEKAAAAQESSAIAAQIRAINGNEKPENWVVIKGESGYDANGNAFTKPDMVMDKTTGQMKPVEYDDFVYDLENNPEAQAINADRTLSPEEKIKKLAALKNQNPQ